MTNQFGSPWGNLTNQNASSGGFNVAAGRDANVTNVTVSQDGWTGGLATELGNGLPVRGAAGGGLVLLLLAAIWIMSPTPGADDKAIPADARQLPTWISPKAVKAFVTSEMGKCAQSPVAHPPTCPQSEPQAATDAKARWTLHGSPADGLVMRYKEGIIYVEGVAVMTVTYPTPSKRTMVEADLQVHEVQYYGEIAWKRAGQPNLRILSSTSKRPPAKIKKAIPEVNPSVIYEKVRLAVDRCVAVQTVVQPPGCPVRSQDVAAFNVLAPRWSLIDDPIRSARISHDDRSGLIHVDGLCVMELRDGDRSVSELSRPYRAEIIADQGGVQVLAIEFKASRLE